MKEKILFVDDEPRILDGFKRQLRDRFHVHTASTPIEGLKRIQYEGPFPVIVSDLKMPLMDGVRFLTRSRQMNPDSVRILLTGHADLESAMDAVNRGHIFSFLTKPCPRENLIPALESGLEQYRLVMAEKELLEQTLRQCLQIFNELLAMARPDEFGNMFRIVQYATAINVFVTGSYSWEVETAAMLSRIGCITLPPELLARHTRETLTPDEAAAFDAHRTVAVDLVGKIPRLAGVTEIIKYQNKGLDGSGTPQDSPADTDIPFGARILKATLDFDTLRTRGLSPQDVFAELQRHPKRYDPAVMAGLERVVRCEGQYLERPVDLIELAPGMLFAEDIISCDDILLVTKGQVVSPLIRTKLQGYAERGELTGPIRMICPHSSLEEELNQAMAEATSHPAR